MPCHLNSAVVLKPAKWCKREGTLSHGRVRQLTEFTEFTLHTSEGIYSKLSLPYIQERGHTHIYSSNFVQLESVITLHPEGHPEIHPEVVITVSLPGIRPDISCGIRFD